jgi:hypothetical protein
VVDRELDLADGDRVALVEPARRHERAAGHTVAQPILVELFEQEHVLGMRPLDLDAEILGQLRRATAMIEMAMRHQDLLDRDVVLFHLRLEQGQITAGIDERATHRLGAP